MHKPYSNAAVRLLILFVSFLTSSAYGFFNSQSSANSMQIDAFTRVYHEQYGQAGYADIGLVQTLQGRLMHENQLADDVYLDAHYVLAWDSVFYKNSGLVPQHLTFDDALGFATSSNAYRMSDLKQSHALDEQNRIVQNLDRLVVHKAFEWGDVHLGRQAITLGIARFSQQSDVLYPVSFNNLQSDYRQGVDAARLEIPMGMLSVLDLAWVQGENHKRSAGFMRFKSHVHDMEYEITAMQLNKDSLWTLSLQQSLNNVGLWQELSLIKDENKSNRHFHRLSLGMDNTVSDFLISAEYFYNELGSDTELDYINRAASFNVNNKNAIYFLAQQYVFIGANYLEGSQNNFSINYALNLNDNSQLLSFVVNHNINAVWDVNLQTSAPLSMGGASRNSEFSQYFHSFSLNLSAVF